MASPGASSRWYTEFDVREDSCLRLVCFPHSGASAAYFAALSRAMPEDVHVVAVSLPGRGAKASEPSFTEMSALVDALAPNLLSLFGEVPVAFFGHSLGGLVAFEVVRWLRRHEHALPVLLVVSSIHGPQIPIDTQSRLAPLPDADFIAAVQRRYGALPDAVLDPAVLGTFLPPLRADLAVYEGYCYAEQPPLSVPLVAYHGGQDASISERSVRAWEAQAAFVPDPSLPTASRATLPAFDMRLFENGGHFYVETEAEEFHARLRHDLRHAVACLPVSYLRGPRSTAVGDMGRCIHLVVEDVARRTPDALAIVGPGRTYTYAEALEAALLLARWLQMHHIAQGMVVGTYMRHVPEYVIANWGIFKAGAAIFPLETNYTRQLVHELLQVADVRVVLSCDEFVRNVPEATTTWLMEDDWQRRMAQLALPPFQDPQVTTDSLAYLTMTSGSTGQPKAVMSTHASAVMGWLGRLEMVPYVHAQEVEGLNTFFVWECLRPLYRGITACCIPDALILDPKGLVAFIQTHSITRLLTTPSLLNQVLEYPDLNLRDDLSHMHAWMLMGEVVSQPQRLVEQVRKAMPHVRVVNLYSTWESCDIATATLYSPSCPERTLAGISAPVGHVQLGVEVFLLDKRMRPTPFGSPGTIYIGGAALGLGYLGDPAKTAEKFVANPFRTGDRTGDPAPTPGCTPGGIDSRSPRLYCTGDTGVFLSDKQLQVLGRNDSTIKIRGFKVSLVYVEAQVKQVAAVGAVVATAVFDSESKQPSAICVYLVPAAGEDARSVVSRVQEELRPLVPEYAYPKYYVPLAALPLKAGESRKVDRQRLPPPTDEHKVSDRADCDACAPDPAPAHATHQRLGQLLTEAVSGLLGHTVSQTANLFESGMHSLLAVKFVGELWSLFGISLSVLDLYDNPTIQALVRKCAPAAADGAVQSRPPAAHQPQEEVAVAIVGMAGQFPGADTVERFWDNLRQGRSSVRWITREELRAKAVPAEVYAHPDYVAAGYVLDGVDEFDAAFWGLGRSETELMDPQQRLFLRCAWHAMEHAGQAPGDGGAARTGVFAGCGIDGYLVHHLKGGGLVTPLEPERLFLTETGNEKDYISTRVSYLLDLGGPSVTINSACSSALVAVSFAAQAIVAGQAQAALAGGASVTFPNLGYLYSEGLVSSRDGRVRPFDHRASGTVFGDGVGVVVLKPLAAAVAAGDAVCGVVRGFAVTNDGAQKAGYAAPSVRGQYNCVCGAHAMAGAGPGRVGYVECHATATAIGDGIEIKALTEAFQSLSGPTELAPRGIPVGSVKGNIGHANCAAGVTGLIKTLLCLQHERLVPTAHFEKPSDRVPLARSPFHVHTGLRAWPRDPDTPRVAGVSSFGVGGTNCHVVLQDPPAPAPAPAARPPDAGGPHVLTLSAKTPAALRRNLRALQAFLAAHDEASLAGVAGTLHLGRRAFGYRAAVVCSDIAAAAEALGQAEVTEVADAAGGVVFGFPGQGSHHVGMGRGLYAHQPRYRAAVDDCAQFLAPLLGFDLRGPLLAEHSEASAAAFNSTPTVLQPALFVTEYAMACVLTDVYGLRPVAMVGHSIGEYVAAVVAEVLSLRDALRIVAARAAATEEACRPGAMLSVELPEARLAPVLDDCGFALGTAASPPEAPRTVWLAAVNSPTHVTLSGTPDSIDRLQAALAAAAVTALRLKVNRGYHSPLVAEAAAAVSACAAAITLHPPRIPVTSNVTGKWMGATAQRDYFAQHLLSPVRFWDDMETVSQWRPSVFLEVGPGTALCSLALKCVPPGARAPHAVQSMRHPKNHDANDMTALAQGIARLFEHGAPIDWAAYHAAMPPGPRVPLPGYAFERASHWVRPEASIYVAATPSPPASGRAPCPAPPTPLAPPPAPCLVRYVAPAPGAGVVLYCLAHAGASSRVFSGWTPERAPWLDVCCVELPGHGGRTAEPMPTNSEEDAALVRAVARAIHSDAAGRAVAFCGFSLGANLAVEAALQLQAAHRLPALHISIAGRAPPGDRVDAAEAAVLEDVPYADLAPAEVRALPEWEAHFLPLLKSDLLLDARAERRVAGALRAAGRALTCDVDLFCGLTDAVCPWQGMAQWEALTSGQSATHYFPGGHDFLTVHAQDIFRGVCRALNACRGAVAAGSGTGPARATPLHAVQWLRGASRGPATADGAWAPAETSQALVLTGDEEAVLTSAQRRALAEGALVVVLATPEDGPAEAWAEYNCRQCWHFMALCQALVRAATGGRLVLVCSASHDGALAVGASKAVALEFPELVVQRVYVRGPVARAPALADLRRVVAVALEHPAECDLRIGAGAGGALVPRLSHMPLHPAAPSPVLSTGVYLVTGGTGGLGAAVVDHLLDHHRLRPHQIVALSRSARPHPRGVRSVAADVRDYAALLGALGAVPAVTGIFHLAGVLDDGLLTNMTYDRLRRVALPKVGALHLLRAAGALGWAPQWLVAFSSTSSLLGSAGQSNYCAANAVLDQLAQFGGGAVPVVAVNWGTWGAGMGAPGTRASREAQAKGEAPLDVPTALQCLDEVLRCAAMERGPSQFAVCEVQWDRSDWRGHPLVQHLSPAPSAAQWRPPSPAPDRGPDGSDSEAEAASPGERFLRRFVSRWQLQAPLAALGLDSLGLVQMRNALAREAKRPVELQTFLNPSVTLGQLLQSVDALLARGA